MRKKLIAGNWKMNYTISESIHFVSEIINSINTNELDVVICPNFMALDRVSDILENTNVKLGAQNVYMEEKGAYTGETSCSMLASAGVEYAIIGHSERRKIFLETDDMVNKKAKALLSYAITPILCVGETLEERENEKLYEVISSQVEKGLQEIGEKQVSQNLVIAYEPIWAIGTGKTATKEQAQDMCLYIRNCIEKQYNSSVAQSVRILYGGSVTPSNASEILNEPDIDGALVGGASLKNDFVAIVNY